MTPADKIALAERVERAGADQQGQMLERAWETLAEHSAEFRRFATAHPPRGFDNNAGKFSMMLDAMAYESAAMMLVPEGSYVEISGPSNCGGWACKVDFRHTAFATTPALALTSAALRAQAGEG